MNNDFYSATVQIIVVLLLALSIERHAHKGLVGKHLYNYVSRVNQAYLFVWSAIGIAVSLLHLASFNFGWFSIGKVTALVSVFAILLLFISIYIMDSQQTELQKRGYATLSFLFVPTFITMGLSYLEFFSKSYVDMIFVNFIATLMMIISFMILFRNKKYLLEVRQIIGVIPAQKHKNPKSDKPPKT